MAKLHNNLKIFGESIQNYPPAPNLVLVGSEMTEIWEEVQNPNLLSVCTLFDSMSNRV